MPRWRAWIPGERWWRDDRGSAPIEFILVGLLFLVPLMYAVIGLGAVQSYALGADAAAREIARAVAAATGQDAAVARADTVLQAIAGEYGIDPDGITVGFACVPAGASCPTAGAMLTVTVRTEAPLPLMPQLFSLDRLTAVPVLGTSTQKVSRFWDAGP